jgi:bifunctional non-homologous end joining protein LigD
MGDKLPSLPVKAMLCERYPLPFNDPNWIWEQKYDGIRVIADMTGPNQRLWARSGTDKTNTFPEIKVSCKESCILDGEVISGKSFQNIQHRANRIKNIEQASRDFPALYMVFDILKIRNNDLTNSMLSIRKLILKEILEETENVLLSPYFEDGVKLMEDMVNAGNEGVVGKHLQMTYLPGKRKWIKVKCWKEDIFEVFGYTQGTGRRLPTFGALILSNLGGKYVGEVGTGFTDEDTVNLFNFMSGRLDNDKCEETGTAVIPFKVKIKFLEYTNDGILRLPVFKGIVKE